MSIYLKIKIIAIIGIEKFHWPSYDNAHHELKQSDINPSNPADCSLDVLKSNWYPFNT